MPGHFTAWHFDGTTYVAPRDGERLSAQMVRVLLVARAWGRLPDPDDNWFTLEQLSAGARGSEAAVSARLRDLRKERWGCQRVDRRYVGDGLHRYRVSFDHPEALPALGIHTPRLFGDAEFEPIQDWPRFPQLTVAR